jgi:hypothetical protein
MSRRATLTIHSQRLTPVEIARLWFRRGADFADLIHATHPDFPKAGPDGLFLLSQVQGWFDRFHGVSQKKGVHDTTGEEEDFMRQAAYGTR